MNLKKNSILNYVVYFAILILFVIVIGKLTPSVKAISNNCDLHFVLNSSGTEDYTYTNNEQLSVVGSGCTGVAPYTQAEITFRELNAIGSPNVFTAITPITSGTYLFTFNTNQLNPTQLPASYEISISVDGITTLNIQITGNSSITPTPDPQISCTSFSAIPKPVQVGDTVMLSGEGCPSGSSILELLFYESGNQTGSVAPIPQAGGVFSITVNSGAIGGPGIYDVGVNFGNGNIWIIPNAVIIVESITVTPPSGPIPAEYIPCSEEDMPEYHSRRPYQASPCNPNLQELDLYCANDFITKETFTVSPADADSCVPEGAGQRCYYTFDSVLEVSVDLTDAELPIVGNTQLVPNQVNGGQPQPEQFSYVRRVNEYLTWWLDGAPWKADEELMDPDEIDLEYPEKHLITYGGPIRKLYAKQSQFQSRSDRRGQSAASPRLLHDQIYLCELGDDQVPCQYNETFGQYGIINTNGTADPTDDQFIPTDYERILSGTPESPWMPFTSTEDRLGTIFTILDDSAMLGRQPTTSEGNDVTITSYDFVPEHDADLLYFAHMDEAVSLTELLQRTYRPRSFSADNAYLSEPVQYYNTYRCDLKDVRWNSGDDLFGEIDGRGGQYGSLTPVTSDTGSEITGEDITGLINYSGEFQCYFDTSFASQADCVQDCSTDLNQCDPNNNALIPEPYADCAAYCQNEVCSIPTCTVDALTATSLYTQTPKAEELWDRTVVGQASLLKRMFPHLGHFGEIVKDYPAVTSADYNAQKAEGGSELVSIVSSLSGDPTEEDPGSNAELYIPHLGGIKVLTMTMLQDMIRPKELGSQYLSGGIPPGTGTTGASCTYTDAQITNAMNAAASKYGIPAAMLQAIFEIEGLDFIVDYQNDGEDVYTCTENGAGAAGLMQVVGPSNQNGADTYTGITCESERLATASNPQGDLGICESAPGKLSRCDVDDIFELAARTILTKVGLWNSTSCTATAPFNPTFANIYNASCNYYGTFRAESSTHNYATSFGASTMPNPLRECTPAELDQGQYCMNYCDIVCNKMGLCPPYPNKGPQ